MTMIRKECFITCNCLGMIALAKGNHRERVEVSRLEKGKERTKVKATANRQNLRHQRTKFAHIIRKVRVITEKTV